MSLPETIHPGNAKWEKLEDKASDLELKTVLLEPSPENKKTYVFASLPDALRTYFMQMGEKIGDYIYAEKKGFEENELHFNHMVSDILFINMLLSNALAEVKPVWQQEVLEQFIPLGIEADQLGFVGFGCGGSFRAAIAQPENYGAVAGVHRDLFARLPDMMDIDRKLPLAESFEALLERLLPVLIQFLTWHAEKVLPLNAQDTDVIFKGVMTVAGKQALHHNEVTVKVLRYPHKTVLEIKLNDIYHGPFVQLPHFTIHLTNYERDLRSGPQMPRSLNTRIPFWFIKDSYANEAELLSFSTEELADMQTMFEHPEVIEKPEYHTLEEALQAGLRAIAERSQHLGKLQYLEREITTADLLHGDWWKKYREALLLLLKNNETEEAVFGRSNDWLSTEVIRLFIRLCDFDLELFLRMAVPMGIIDVLQPELAVLLQKYGSNFVDRDTATELEYFEAVLWIFFSRHKLIWRARINWEKTERFNDPNLLGSQFLFNLFPQSFELSEEQRNEPLQKLHTKLRTTPLGSI